MSEPDPPPPESKDWTWVLARPCPECGFDAAGVDVRAGLGPRVVAAAEAIATVATGPSGRVRPTPTTWSPLEYACHVRDACVVFAVRARGVAAQDGVEFDNWDQDATALAERYWQQDPALVAGHLRTAAADAAAAFAAFDDAGGAAWGHTGVRSNGSRFTGDTLARYFLHDLEHHVHDVRAGSR